MSDDQDACEWVFLPVAAYPGSPGPKAVKKSCVCISQCGVVMYLRCSVNFNDYTRNSLWSLQ